MNRLDYLQRFRSECKVFLAQSILRLEAIECSDLQTRQLLDHCGIDTKVDDEEAVIMRNTVAALDFLKATDLNKVAIGDELFIQINHLLAQEQAAIAGSYRTGSTNIDCIAEDIPEPGRDKLLREFARLRNMTKETFRIDVAQSFCNLARMQPFYDGNKRSALFLCNVAMFKKDLGMFTIPIEKYLIFNDKLRDFYVNGSPGLKNFIATELIMTEQEML